MRSLCEIFIIGALLYYGWDIPFGQRIDQLTGKAVAKAPPRVQRIIAAAPTPSGAWMWNQNRRTPLDTPTPNSGTTSNYAHPAASVSGSWMWDPNHRSPLDPPQKAASPSH